MKQKKTNEGGSFASRVYKIVEQIPYGRVASYGQIAWMLGAPRQSRQVGWAMARCPECLPWHRVVKQDGSLAEGGGPALRKKKLEEEGVRFGEDGRVDMEVYRWIL